MFFIYSSGVPEKLDVYPKNSSGYPKTSEAVRSRPKASESFAGLPELLDAFWHVRAAKGGKGWAAGIKGASADFNVLLGGLCFTFMGRVQDASRMRTYHEPTANLRGTCQVPKKWREIPFSLKGFQNEFSYQLFN